MRAITENDFVPYSTELVLPPLYALRPYLPFTPDSTMFVLLWLMTWSFLLTWLTAKVCFKDVTRADHEEVIHDEPVRETEPRDQPLPTTNAAVDEAASAIAEAERRAREEKARADALAVALAVAEAAERERATFAAASAIAEAERRAREEKARADALAIAEAAERARRVAAEGEADAKAQVVAAMARAAETAEREFNTFRLVVLNVKFTQGFPTPAELEAELKRLRAIEPHKMTSAERSELQRYETPSGVGGYNANALWEEAEKAWRAWAADRTAAAKAAAEAADAEKKLEAARNALMVAERELARG